MRWDWLDWTLLAVCTAGGMGGAALINWSLHAVLG